MEAKKGREDPVITALRRVLSDRERYFDKRGALNSDGRKLVARAAKEASSRGLEYSARRAWLFLKDPTLDRAIIFVNKYEEPDAD